MKAFKGKVVKKHKARLAHQLELDEYPGQTFGVNFFAGEGILQPWENFYNKVEVGTEVVIEAWAKDKDYTIIYNHRIVG